jgi:hypothetical protein
MKHLWVRVARPACRLRAVELTMWIAVVMGWVVLLIQ